jgi:hypothetical protein
MPRAIGTADKATSLKSGRLIHSTVLATLTIAAATVNTAAEAR